MPTEGSERRHNVPLSESDAALLFASSRNHALEALDKLGRIRALMVAEPQNEARFLIPLMSDLDVLQNQVAVMAAVLSTFEDSGAMKDQLEEIRDQANEYVALVGRIRQEVQAPELEIGSHEGNFHYNLFTYLFGRGATALSGRGSDYWNMPYEQVLLLDNKLPLNSEERTAAQEAEFQRLKQGYSEKRLTQSLGDLEKVVKRIADNFRNKENQKARKSQEMKKDWADFYNLASLDPRTFEETQLARLHRHYNELYRVLLQRGYTIKDLETGL